MTQRPRQNTSLSGKSDKPRLITANVVGPVKEDSTLSLISRRLKRIFLGTRDSLVETVEDSDESFDNRPAIESYPETCGFSDIFDHIQLRPDIVCLSAEHPEFQRYLLSELETSLRRLREHVYDNLSHESELAAFCQHVLGRLTMVSTFFRSDIPLDDYLLTCLKLAIPTDTFLPKSVVNRKQRTMKFKDWENRVNNYNSSVGNILYFLKLYQNTISRFVDEVYTAPAQIKRYHKKSEFFGYDDFSEPRRLYKYVDRVENEEDPHWVSMSDFLPPDIASNVRSVIDSIMPRGMDSRRLFRTPAFLTQLWRSYQMQNGDLSKATVGNIIDSLIPLNTSLDARYLGVSSAMSLSKDESGNYDAQANCLKNALLWAPFYHMDRYKSSHYASWNSDETEAIFDETEDYFDEEFGSINKYSVIVVSMMLYGLSSSRSNISQILKALAPDIHPRHFAYMTRSHMESSKSEKQNSHYPKLLDRLILYSKHSFQLLDEHALHGLLEIFVNLLRVVPLDEWELPHSKFGGQSPREVLSAYSQDCFPETDAQSEMNFEKYQSYVSDQVSKWTFLNEKGDSRSPENIPVNHQMSRRFVGWRKMHRDLCINFWSDLFAHYNIDMTRFVVTNDQNELYDVLSNLSDDPQTRKDFLLLMTHKKYGLQLLHYPYWKRR